MSKLEQHARQPVRIAVFAAAIVVGMALPACGPSKSAAPGTTTAAPATTAATSSSTAAASISALAERFVTLGRPLQAALDTFTNGVAALGDNPRAADVAGLAAPAIAALNSFDEALLREPWPPNVKTDVDALVTADRTLESDLGAVGSPASAWVNQFGSDEGKLSAAFSIVRADLGLPPTSG
jgi:hypothetical protein